MTDLEELEAETLQQFVEFHMCDHKVWGLSLSITSVAKLIETFHSSDYDTLTIGLDDERQWYLNKSSIVGITVMNLEDMEIEFEPPVRPRMKKRS